MVDFVSIAFSLFGYNLLSLYLTYFILFSVPVWLFFRAFRDRPACVAILAVLVLSHLAIFASAVFDLTGGTLGSPTNPRFLSVLAIVPGLHIGLAIVLGLEPSRRNVGLTALQAGMIVFACWIRSSAVWVPFGLLVLAACVGIRFRSLRGLWSLGLLAALFLLHSVYLTVMLDPVYRRSGDIGRHPMWHSIFYSLQLHPEWKTKYAATYHGADGDDLTPIVAKKYLERHPPADLQALYFHEATGTLKWAALESVVRSAFFEFAVNDPTFVLAAFLIHKPRHLFQELRAYVQSIKRLARPWRYFVIASSLLMIAFFASSSAERRILNQCAALVAGGFVVSLIPIILTVTFRAVISDQFFMLVMATTAVSLAAASGAVSGVVWLVGSRRWLVRRAAT
jgi:hypothetical protein